MTLACYAALLVIIWLLPGFAPFGFILIGVCCGVGLGYGKGRRHGAAEAAAFFLRRELQELEKIEPDLLECYEPGDEIRIEFYDHTARVRDRLAAAEEEARGA